METPSRELDSWKEAIEKAVNSKAKTLFQLSSSSHKMDSKCPWGNKPTKKEEKDFGKINLTDTPSANKSSGKH